MGWMRAPKGAFFFYPNLSSKAYFRPWTKVIDGTFVKDESHSKKDESHWKLFNEINIVITSIYT